MTNRWLVLSGLLLQKFTWHCFAGNWMGPLRRHKALVPKQGQVWGPRHIITYIIITNGKDVSLRCKCVCICVQEECQNYIRVLLLSKGKLFTCGTNAFAPVCVTRQVGIKVLRFSISSKLQNIGLTHHSSTTTRSATPVRCWTQWTVWPAARTTRGTTPQPCSLSAVSSTPPPSLTSQAATPSSTGAWATCRHCGVRSTTPSGSMVRPNTLLTLCFSLP